MPHWKYCISLWASETSLPGDGVTKLGKSLRKVLGACGQPQPQSKNKGPARLQKTRVRRLMQLPPFQKPYRKLPKWHGNPGKRASAPPQMAPARSGNVPQKATKRTLTKPHYLLGFDACLPNSTYHSGKITFFAFKNPLWKP